MEPTRRFAGLYESFALDLFGGNVAGVVITADQLADEVMQGLATELSVPTTGFIALGRQPGHTLPTRYFTPRQEIDACGYVTIALATALAELGVWSDPAGAYRIVASGGTYDLTFGERSDRREVRLAVKVLGHERADAAVVERLTGLPLHPEYRPEIISTGLRHLIVLVKDVETLRAYKPERAPAERLGRELGVDTIGLVAATPGGVVRLRDVCAPIGDLEEPASGTTSAAVADFLARQGHPPSELDDGRSGYEIRQGDEIGRPSAISSEMPTEDRVVLVAGSARPVIAGELRV